MAKLLGQLGLPDDEAGEVSRWDGLSALPACAHGLQGAMGRPRR